MKEQILKGMKEQILKGREAVDTYRAAHIALHQKPWHKGVPEEHTPLLEKMVAELEEQGFTSAHTDFESKKMEILARLWADSDDLNAQELGFASKVDFDKEIERLRKIPDQAKVDKLILDFGEKWK